MNNDRMKPGWYAEAAVAVGKRTPFIVVSDDGKVVRYRWWNGDLNMWCNETWEPNDTSVKRRDFVACEQTEINDFIIRTGV